jgi:hypothetical protein
MKKYILKEGAIIEARKINFSDYIDTREIFLNQDRGVGLKTSKHGFRNLKGKNTFVKPPDPPKGYDTKTEGYMVIYPNAKHIMWCQKDLFEENHIEIK